MDAKKTLRELQRLFSSTAPSSSTSCPANPFPAYALPPDIVSLLEEHIRTFASSFPLSAAGAAAGQSEGERERARWREGLLDIWTSAEPLPGTERELHNIGKVSAFLALLDKLSADVGDDDEAALISRQDIGSVWWNAVLRRTMLGTAKEDDSAASTPRAPQPRGRKLDRKGKEPAHPSSSSSSSSTPILPLYVSRQALAAATRMIVWGMVAPSRSQGEQADDWVSPFAGLILNEYEDRALARLKGLDEGYGIRNLEECLIMWGEKSPKAFFARLSTLLSPSLPALLPTSSLLLSFLARHSAKAYHALSTPLVANLVTAALTVSSVATVSLALKCLDIFVATLPVIIGEHLFGIMAVYARAVSWETAQDLEDDGDAHEPSPTEDLSPFLEVDDDKVPNPTGLFTVLYGIYPVNFTAFLRDANAYLRDKAWPGALGDGVIDVSSVMVRTRSEPILRTHTLHPDLFGGDAAKELTDTKRWARLEAADVRAQCDRNVAQPIMAAADDWRGAVPVAELEHDDAQPQSARSAGFEPVEEGVPLDSTSATPKATSPGPSRSASRAVSRVRSATPSTTGTASPVRVSTPLMPATTHFTNFQALQSTAGSPTSMSPARRSGSRFRVASANSDGVPEWPGTLELSGMHGAPVASAAHPHNHPHAHPHAHPLAPSTMSRRSSGVASHGTGVGLLSPELVPVGSTRGVSPAPTTAHIVKLERDVLLLKGEVDFQNYLKQLHLQHMGTLHREKVLESGAEAERQSSFRTIRTLRAQLRATQNALDQLRSEQAATKANWTAHIADLRDKLSTLREQRMRWDHDEKMLQAEVADWKDRFDKKGKELVEEGSALFDLRNQVSLDEKKLSRIAEYEHRIEALTKTLAICDADLVKFVEQRKEMNLLVGEWKKSELLRETVEQESKLLKKALRAMENDLAEARRSAASSAGPGAGVSSSASKGELVQLRREMDRLRMRNLELEERLADVLDDKDADVLAGSEEADEVTTGEDHDGLVASSNGR
ncbi:uncharacterized protein RHOBADRAFT_55517 [Rhodotorula graminis WP1]|uniref:Hamartin protein n=1 Tax=Rhodotorula graminis (strain WP1) TaxID=578459 RepID=A0A0P9FB20_RHOGW|nr:uncharacterized protein RHOBADRAFT_55517 [Rhodotorula graminis WP1]KPV72843.1 hypothetical protein RHOBADRAFT_55517 [Rhodotorula graminis WP1]